MSGLGLGCLSMLFFDVYFTICHHNICCGLGSDNIRRLKRAPSQADLFGSVEIGP